MKALSLKVLLAIFATAVSARAADYPSQPLRWVVPYPAGGYADSVTRVLAPRLQEALKHPVVVENRPGANSMLGSALVAKAPPDGHVLLSVIAGHAVNATLYADRMAYDPVRSFTPVALLTVAPLLLAVHNEVPARNLQELLQHAKRHPGKLSYGSSGIGAGAHLATELLRLNEGIDLVHVPYKGGAPAVQALVAGEIQLLVDVPSVLMPHVRTGKVRALGVLAPERVSGLDLPTLTEAGAKPIVGATWVMVLVPAGTPAAVISRLSSELQALTANETVRQRFEQLGTLPVASSPEQAAQFLDAEIAKWRSVIQRAGVKAEP